MSMSEWSTDAPMITNIEVKFEFINTSVFINDDGQVVYVGHLADDQRRICLQSGTLTAAWSKICQQHGCEMEDIAAYVNGFLRGDHDGTGPIRSAH